jgi:hypothetical protein
MRGNVISYDQMCANEGAKLQRGMNFKMRGGNSVILMSIHPSAPYQDQISSDGSTLIYEGHDEARSPVNKTPKALDQPMYLPSGRPTENGKFFLAAENHKSKGASPEIVRVYEKIKKGIWSDNGFFNLIDAWQESDGERGVFKFKFVAIDEAPVGDIRLAPETTPDLPHTRLIPTAIKLEVWKRDKGKCTACGAKDNLHFDHIFPFSKGGTSLLALNVQLLCARHNLEKSARIL